MGESILRTKMTANYFCSKSSETANEDWQLPLSFLKKHHAEPIEGTTSVFHSWRMKERVSFKMIKTNI